MRWFTTSPVLLALTAAMLYGIGAPIMKVAGQSGATANGLLFAYGTGSILVSLVYMRVESTLYTSVKGGMLSALFGLMLGAAFLCIGRAFTLPTGLVTVVMALVASYPLLSSAIELTLMGQHTKVRLPLAILGTVLVVTGAFLVSMSVRPHQNP